MCSFSLENAKITNYFIEYSYSLLLLLLLLLCILLF